MNYSDEQRIARAVRQRDAALLAEAVQRLPSYDRDYDAVANVVRAAGGASLVRMNEIRLGDTVIRNRMGRPTVNMHTW